MRGKQRRQEKAGMDERIAIVGAGAAGVITAAWLTGNGHKVILCDSKEQCREDFAVIARKGIVVKGPGLISGLCPDRMTYEIAEAMEARLVLVCVSSGRQEEAAGWMAPWVRPDHDLLLMPGNLGTVIFHRKFKEEGVTYGLLAELAECLWACRRLGPGSYVSAMPPGQRRIAAFPSTETGRALERFGKLFSLKAGASLVENCLNSPNVLTHLSGTLLNLGGIEQKKGDFALFTDGMSDEYIRCLEILEAERSEVLKVMGAECYAAPLRPFMTMLKASADYPELEAFKKLSGPDGLWHRYVTEDAACGVALLVSLAEKFDVEAPAAKALLTLASSLTGIDYRQSGRTWEWLGNDAAGGLQTVNKP